MITDIFEGLSEAVSGTPLIAILASLAWGVLSIILSPCHLASIPLIIGFIGDQGAMTTRRAFTLALLFSLGILNNGMLGIWFGGYFFVSLPACVFLVETLEM